MGASISSLIPELQPYCRELLFVAGQAGLQPRITSTRRSTQEQARLYRNFLNGTSAYPVAPPGTSAHEYGYAFDMMVMSNEMQSDLQDLGQVWESWGGVWGGHFKDPIHFEYPGFNAEEKHQSFWDYLRYGKTPKLAEDALKIIPGVELVSDLVAYLGIK